MWADRTTWDFKINNQKTYALRIIKCMMRMKIKAYHQIAATTIKAVRIKMKKKKWYYTVMKVEKKIVMLKLMPMKMKMNTQREK